MICVIYVIGGKLLDRANKTSVAYRLSHATEVHSNHWGVLAAIYATAIFWIYATEPRSFREVATVAQVAIGAYQIDQEKFTAALTLFRRDHKSKPNQSVATNFYEPVETFF